MRVLPDCLPERSLSVRLGVALSCAEGSAGASAAVCLRCRGVYGMPLLRDFLRRRCAWSELAAEFACDGVSGVINGQLRECPYMQWVLP